MKRWIGIALVIVAVAGGGAGAQDGDGTELDVRCGAEWVTFQQCPRSELSEEKPENPNTAALNCDVDIILTIRKADVRNVMYDSDFKVGKINLGRLGEALVTEQVYRDVVLCLN